MLGDILGIDETQIESLSQGKLLPIPGPRMPFSAVSGTIVQTHIKNLILTYGLDIVMYHVTEVIKESK